MHSASRERSEDCKTQEHNIWKVFISFFLLKRAALYSFHYYIFLPGIISFLILGFLSLSFKFFSLYSLFCCFLEVGICVNVQEII